MKNPKDVVLKYALTIIICQVILLLAWTSLSADVRLINYESVKSLLNSIPSQTQQHPEFFMAAHAIRNASRNIDILNYIILLVSLITIFQSIVVWLRIRKYLGENNQTTITNK